MLLESAVERLKFTGRSIDKVLKVALTIATLEGGTRVGKKHIAEAIQYRKKEINI
jgi:magnesium chelatase family protein